MHCTGSTDIGKEREMIAPVSTIIPCYRCSDTISRAVDSVAKQTLLPAEVILVDDGSGDNTPEILLQLQRDYGKDWIKVIALKDNRGPAVARNTAWDLASQDYIAFLDADEIWHPEKIAVQYSWMHRHPDIVLCGHDSIQINPETQFNYQAIPTNIKASLVFRNQILLSNVFSTACVTIKREIGQRFSPSLRYSQDYFLWLEIILRGGKAAIMHFSGAYYFKNLFGEGGQTAQVANGKKAELEIYRRLWKSGSITSVERRFLSLWSLVKYYRRLCLCLLR
jgi:glycosyltransferase involved in cell wall biosynthesis